MIFEYSLSTNREDFYNITPQVREAVAKSGATSGITVVYCPHTTAGTTINENADPDVVHDLLIGLNKAFPDRSELKNRKPTFIPLYNHNFRTYYLIAMDNAC